MEAIKEPDWNTVGILGAARGAQSGSEDAIGTEHLLAGFTTSRGAAREALADEGATGTALLAVIRDRANRDAPAWSADDDAEGTVAAPDVLGEDGDRRERFTGAAARALTAAMERARREGAAKFNAVHLLRALLEDDNRAVELLGVCGIAPQSVRARLDAGATGTGATGGREDGLPTLLHTTRDVLLGRSHYRHLPFWKRWLVKHAGTNVASRPAWWIELETYDQARRLGHRAVGTEHVLLAILATHEVALRYPHLAGENAPTPDSRYTGGEHLTRLGLDYTSVHTALTSNSVPLTTDPRPVKQYLTEATAPTADPTATGSAAPDSAQMPAPTPDPGTGPLVDTLLSEKTRARQLINALTATSDA